MLQAATFITEYVCHYTEWMNVLGKKNKSLEIVAFGSSYFFPISRDLLMEDNLKEKHGLNETFSKFTSIKGWKVQ